MPRANDAAPNAYQSALWPFLESHIGRPVDRIIQNILALASLDHRVLLNKFKKADGSPDIQAFEDVVLKFVRNGDYLLRVGEVEEDQRADYFGDYYGKMAEFQFAPGETIALDLVLKTFLDESIPIKEWKKVEKWKLIRKRKHQLYRAPLQIRQRRAGTEALDERDAHNAENLPFPAFDPEEDIQRLRESLDARKITYCQDLQAQLPGILIAVELNEESREVKAVLTCPFCKSKVPLAKTIRGSSLRASKGSWTTSNFDRHYILHGTRVQVLQRKSKSQLQNDERVANGRTETSPGPNQFERNFTPLDVGNGSANDDSGFESTLEPTDATQSIFSSTIMPPGPGPVQNCVPATQFPAPLSTILTDSITMLS